MGLSVPLDPALARSIYNPQALGFVPPSTPWLSDTLNGLDLYKLGFGMTPTIYFDPNAAETSRNLGAYQNPYTSLAQVQTRCAGFMGGQVLGVKRGSFIRGTLTLSCFGSGAAPFVIAPYGDAPSPAPSPRSCSPRRGSGRPPIRRRLSAPSRNWPPASEPPSRSTDV